MKYKCYHTCHLKKKEKKFMEKNKNSLDEKVEIYEKNLVV